MRQRSPSPDGQGQQREREVRSTHGVNCTGSCSWKVYVKDGIITWETQQTDYPSVGPDSPEHDPRGASGTGGRKWRKIGVPY
jgi:nitrate reductase / nitrite oxidoreductase, alpha subunit